MSDCGCFPALKELVRQSEADQGKTTASTHEKVRNIVQRLNHLKSKASRSRHSGKCDGGQAFGENRIVNLISIPDASGREEEKITEHEAETEQLMQPFSGPSTPLPERARSETPGSEKIQLLRQQMEQNRRKMAERENSKRGISW